MRKNFLYPLFIAAILTSCSETTGSAPTSANALFEEGKQLLAIGDPNSAAAKFSEIDKQFPFSSIAPEAQLYAGFANVQRKNYLEAEIELKLFLERYPTHPKVDYALYLLGLTFYVQFTSIDRDPYPARAALEQFERLLRLHPRSAYTKDATVRMQVVINHLAAHAVTVAKYYQRKQFLVSAVMRYTEILERFPSSAFTPEILARLVECYAGLGLVDDARRSLNILAVNFPDSSWLEQSEDVMAQISDVEATRG